AAGTDPKAFGDDASRWRPIDELITRPETVRGPAVAIVDGSMLDVIARLRQLPQNVVLLAADDQSEAECTCTHASVAGVREPVARRRVLDATCQLACARAISLRRRHYMAYANRRLRQINWIGLALMQERDQSALLEAIIHLGKELSDSDGAGLFLA